MNAIDQYVSASIARNGNAAEPERSRRFASGMQYLLLLEVLFDQRVLLVLTLVFLAFAYSKCIHRDLLQILLAKLT